MIGGDLMSTSDFRYMKMHASFDVHVISVMTPASDKKSSFSICTSENQQSNTKLIKYNNIV